MTETRRTYDHGNREAAMDGEILRGLVGSQAHGTNLPGTDDRDELGVFIEPPEHVVGVSSPLDNFISRTQPNGVRSGHGDIDVTLYSLRKYLRLALAGNPSILILLYTPTPLHITELGYELRELAPLIVSQKALNRFFGYLVGQRERLTGGGKRNRVPNRPELIEKHGWDTKYGSHALRLGIQGVELATTGKLSLPMQQEHRTVIMSMRRGEIPYPDALNLIDQQSWKLATLIDEKNTVLPATPLFDTVNEWCVNAHYRFWRGEA